MKATKLKEGIYWVGAVDWNIRNFHGYSTEQGTSYGAYLIVDEKVTLIDTVKAPFAEEMISRISDILPPENIDIIISNHVEMDHSGALPAIRKPTRPFIRAARRVQKDLPLIMATMDICL